MLMCPSVGKMMVQGRSESGLRKDGIEAFWGLRLGSAPTHGEIHLGHTWHGYLIVVFNDINKLYTAASLEIVQVVLYLGLHEGWVPTLSTSFHSFTVMPYRSYIHHLKSFGALIVESHLIKHLLLIHIFIYVLIINYVKMILIMINTSNS